MIRRMTRKQILIGSTSAVVVAGLLIGGILLWNRSGSTATQGTSATTSATPSPSATPTPSASISASASPSATPTLKPTPPPGGGAPPTASPSAKAHIILTALSFGNVPLGDNPADALDRLGPVLGPPDSDVVDKGCELKGPNRKSRILSWDELSLHGEYPASGPEALTSWTVRGTNTPSLSLPHGLVIGSPASEVAKSMPIATIDDSRMFNDGRILIDDDIWWFLDAANQHLIRVEAHPQLCE